eukprot:GILJ01002531.1.p1 GENE.GILJ01002531.1~~GILJ01002531.1.p1  ORF type:complete len:399 (+),score=61.28 GILJ01002531.1:71-1267(+)
MADYNKAVENAVAQQVQRAELPDEKEAKAGVWDLETQTPHGGQDWRLLDTYIEDFSVTTNGLGTPKSAMWEAARALQDVLHYPAANFEPAWGALAGFLAGDKNDVNEIQKRLLLGNGASELIDLVIRVTPAGDWKEGPSVTQYKEYERSAENTNRRRLAKDDRSAALTCIVNPCNPTGDYMNLPTIQNYIETNCGPNSTVIIDESMQPWLGPNWRDDSLTGCPEWIRSMYEKGIKVFVIHSWTKLWACPGIRIGSILAPHADEVSRIKKVQVPWSVNEMAVRFTAQAISDIDYLRITWELTPIWRKQTVEALKKQHPDWEMFGEPWLSWIWADTKDIKYAAKAVIRCKKAGVPIRWGRDGYDQPTFIRIAVRSPALQVKLFEALDFCAPLKVHVASRM